MKANANQPRLVAVLNSSIALGFLQGQLEYFRDRGFDVTVLCPKRRDDEWEIAPPKGIPILDLPMERNISPLRDLVSVWRLCRAMRMIRPTVTNVGTPKAGLLGGFAAWLNRVPARFYTLHGLRFETTTVLKRKILIWAERLACRFAHRAICVSHSVREKAIAFGLTTREQSVVFGSGSCNGVDVSRFGASPKLMQRAGQLRKELKIPPCVTVIMFVGRLTRDKGIPELMHAFSQLDKRYPDVRLLLAGCFEDGDPLPQDVRRSLKTHPHVISVGAVQDTPAYYAMADIVVLPSHREGLPLVVLEAQAAGKPVVGARATGIVDLIKDGETGLLFSVGDALGLSKALEKLIADKELAERLGRAGTEQVKRDFQQELIWEATHQEYVRILLGNGWVPRPIGRENRSLIAKHNQ
jgi:glycosyltransferase involved in cell wall biosynthesis